MMQKRNILRIFIVIFILTTASLAFATDVTAPIDFVNPIKANSLYCFVRDILSVVVKIGFSIAVLFLVYTGFEFVTARGDENQLKTAKSMFLWTVIGTAVLLGSWLIAITVENTVNKIRYGDNPPNSTVTTTCPS